MKNVYVELNFTHNSFTTGKTAIVELPDFCEYLTTYKKMAIKKVCEKLGLDEKEVVVFDYKFLGKDIMFI